MMKQPTAQPAPGWPATVLSSLALPLEKMQEIEQDFAAELARPPMGDRRMLACLDSFVTHQPTGQERGEFGLIDLGGSNLRIGTGTLLGNHRYEMAFEQFRVPAEIKAGTGDGLFSYIAQKVAELIPEGRHRIGFTFSFPVEQTALTNGKILSFTKAYRCEDAIGQDAVGLLQERLDRLAAGRFEVAALMNDTVATLVTHAYKQPLTRMSVVLGTGTNAACWLARDGRQTIINTEWGGYGDGAEPHVLPRTGADRALDAASGNPGHQAFEKMVSALYLGEVFRLTCGGMLGDEYRQPQSVSTEQLLDVAPLARDPGEAAGLQAVADHLLLRSARLVAPLISAIYKASRRGAQDFVVAIDGSLYTQNAGYQRDLASAVRELGCADNLILQVAQGKPLIGPAIAVAKV